MPVRLHSGHSIHTVSALILHLVQSSAYGVDQRMKNELSRIAEQPDGAEDGAEESAVVSVSTSLMYFLTCSSDARHT